MRRNPYLMAAILFSGLAVVALSCISCGGLTYHDVCQTKRTVNSCDGFENLNDCADGETTWTFVAKSCTRSPYPTVF